MAIEKSTWESPTEIPLGTVIGGLVPEDSPRQLVVTKFIMRTQPKGWWLYEVEVREVDLQAVEDTLP